jgi:hypothetical protein
MLDFLLRYRFGAARVLSIVVAIGLSLYLTNAFDWPWWASSLVGIVCLLFVPVLWGIVLGIFEMLR